MKRSGPLKRTTPLESKTPLKSSSMLKRAKRKAARAPEKMREEVGAALWWHEAVTKTVAGRWRPCAVCGGLKGVQGHHTVKQQTLRREAKSRDIDPALLLWDTAVGMPVCRDCHERHTSGARRIPHDKLLPVNVQFAETHGLSHFLEREHPFTPTDGETYGQV